MINIIRNKNDCSYGLNIVDKGLSIHALYWAADTFGIDNVDFIRAGNEIYFKNDVDRTMFIMKWMPNG